jgi:hypothetical protein
MNDENLPNPLDDNELFLRATGEEWKIANVAGYENKDRFSPYIRLKRKVLTKSDSKYFIAIHGIKVIDCDDLEKKNLK